MRVVFYLGPAFERWTPKSIEEKGSGASEWMAVEIAEHLASLGHEVTVYSDNGLTEKTMFGGVAYLSHNAFGVGPVSDVLVAYRRPEVLDLSCLAQTERIVFVTTDKHHEGALSDAQVAMATKIVVVSEWHKQRFMSVHKNVPERKVRVIQNGVRVSASPVKRRTDHLVHTSSPDRGLEQALEAMPEIRRRIPEAALHVYADFSVPLAFARQQQNAARVAHLEKLERELTHNEWPGVRFHGRACRAELHRALGQARVWVYPATAEETSCVAAMEAQALGCRVVAARLGALPETCMGPGCELVEPSNREQYVDAVVRALAVVAPPREERFSLDKALAEYAEVITGVKSAPQAIEVVHPHYTHGEDIGVPGLSTHHVLLGVLARGGQARGVERAIVSAIKAGLAKGVLLLHEPDAELVRAAVRSARGVSVVPVQRMWQGFSQGQAELGRLAKSSGAGWVMLLDEDMECESPNLFAPVLDRSAHGYLVRTRAHEGRVVECQEPLLLNLAYDWTFEGLGEGGLHPLPHAAVGPVQWNNLEGFVVTRHADATESLVETVERRRAEAEDIKRHLTKNPGDARGWFYLGQAYRDGALISHARDAYLRRADMGGNEEEVYCALVEAARITEKLTDSWDEIKGAWSRAIDSGLGARAEALMGMARLHKGKGRYRSAVTYANIAGALTIPSAARLLVEPDAYGDSARKEAKALCDLSATESLDVPDDGMTWRSVTGTDGYTWRLGRPRGELYQSLDDIIEPIAEALGRVAGTRGVPSTGTLWFGAHAAETPEPPPTAIVYQSEVANTGWFTARYRRILAQAAEVWDYSSANQAHYEARVKRHVPIRWSPCQTRGAGSALRQPTHDIGLIGSKSSRRTALEPELKIFEDVHGAERARVERSIAVHVVPHYYESAPVEQARIGKLLAQGFCVVAENAPDEGDYPGPVYAPYYDLVAVGLSFARGADLPWLAQGRRAQAIYMESTMVDALVKAYHVNPAFTAPLLPLVASHVVPERFPTPLRLNLGACDAESRVEGFVSVDVAPGADVTADLTKPWPWADSSVDEIRAHDIIEHLPDKIFTMNEAYRVLKPGGVMKIQVPTTDGRGAFQDPTHCCHDEATEVLTTQGFKLFSSLDGAESIYTLNADSGEAEVSAIARVHSYDFDGEMVRFSGRGVDALVTPNHRMYAGSSDETTAFRFRDALELVDMKSPVRMPHGVRFGGALPEYWEIPGSRLRNQDNPGQRFVGDTVRLPVEPLMEFMGWYLSEGWCSVTRDGQHIIGVAQSESAHPEWFARIGECIVALGYRPHRGSGGWLFSDADFGAWLRKLGRSHEKFVPREFMEMHPDLLGVLFKSAMLGDAHAQGEKSWAYGTTSVALASDIAEVALRLGYRVSISREARVGKPVAVSPDYRANYDMNLVYVSHSKHRYLTNARREKYTGKVYCVTAATNDVICTRRNGKVLWSGNSYWNRNSFWYFTAGDAHRERFGDRYGVKARFREVEASQSQGGSAGIAHLYIVLEAVKPAPSLDLNDTCSPEEAQRRIAAAKVERAEMMRPKSAPLVHVKNIPDVKAEFVAMLRVKNEARWIGNVVSALRTVCDEVLVMDDRSDDGTYDIAHRAGAKMLPTPFRGLDETRDKNWLWQRLVERHATRVHPDTPLWVIAIDGDEELEPFASEILREHLDPRVLAYSFQVLYLWDREDQVRVDGVYASFRRFSMFRAVRADLKFEGTMKFGNLHCKSVPDELIPGGKEHPLKLLHYGYLDRETRARKFEHYNRIDPKNDAEDEYRHIVQGDGVVDAGARLKWGGPLTLAPLGQVLAKGR